ncbi:MAG: aminomethyltransferase family protein, partial [Actinomycetota bacterium]
PNEELPAARNHLVSPIHDRLTAHNAVWGASFGLEVPLWFQKPGLPAEEHVTFRRSNAFAMVAEEVAAVRERVGLFETTGYAKYEFSGPGARAFLDLLLPNHIPAAGRLALSPMLNRQGKLIGDFTVGALASKHGEERFVVFGSGTAQRYHERWFRQEMATAAVDDAGDRSVTLRVWGNELCGLSIAGPNARALLAGLVDVDVSNDAFAFLDLRDTWVGSVPAIVGRISFTGDLGYEIWCAASYQQQLFDTIMNEGRPHGIRLFGGRALDSMRLDKGWGAWATEYRPIYDPVEANMGWMVRLGDDKGDFIGRDAAVAATAAGPQRRLVLFEMDAGDGDTAADCIGNEPIWHGDGDEARVVGWVTSGGYAHHSRMSIAMGYVPAVLAEETDGWHIEVIGDLRTATRLKEPPFDPAGARMRA